ncbi:ABC transporter ATP-binding protein, partial [Nocardia salmonicida]|uniref:ABC transporter ATP-binding protein n=1 Tax=Nocardia salmonicida TaxID=53431 RepID=UPI0033FB77BF
MDDVHISYKTFGGRRLEGGQARARDLRRHVGAVDVVHAVRGVSFMAHHGESIGVIGHNGSGKSTLLKAITGALPLRSGRIWTDGTASLLGVNAALMPALTGERNIVLGGLALGLTRAQIEERFDEVVDFAGIGDFLELPMKAYSSGMGSRLRFAISSAAQPDILLIDEALATGDSQFRARSEKRIDEIRSRAGTVLLVSHSLSTVAQMCDRVIWIDHGRLR